MLIKQKIRQLSFFAVDMPAHVEARSTTARLLAMKTTCVPRVVHLYSNFCHARHGSISLCRSFCGRESRALINLCAVIFKGGRKSSKAQQRMMCVVLVCIKETPCNKESLECCFFCASSARKRHTFYFVIIMWHSCSCVLAADMRETTSCMQHMCLQQQLI